MESFFKDIRYGLRSLLKHPTFTAISIITLALGIGANAAIFTVVNAVVLRPLPYHDSERLAMLWTTKDANQEQPFSFADYNDLKSQSKSFSALGAASPLWNFVLSGDGEPEPIQGMYVSANMFELLKVAPEKGRGFTADEDRTGGPPVVIISRALWERRFGGDPNLIGKLISISSTTATNASYQEPQKRAVFMQQLETNLRAAPEVASVGFVTRLPLMSTLNNITSFLAIEGREVPLGERPEIDFRRASTGYFQTMGIPLLSGRLVTEQDVANNSRFVLINDAMAKRFWPGEDPVGRRISTIVSSGQHVPGVRMALGASATDVMKMVLRNGMSLALIGVGLGLVGAFVLTRLMSRLLFEVTWTDVTTLRLCLLF